MNKLSATLEQKGKEMDAEEDKLRRSLLIFACALMNFSVMVWLAIYWFMGLHFSTNFPLAYQLVSISSLVYFLKTGNFVVFRFIQLSLFLFAPFIMQWSIGSSATSSGLMLWALLAPVGAVVVASWRESIPWFIAYIVLTAVSGFFDYFLGAGELSGISMQTVGVFFALNFAALSSIIYFLVRYFVLGTERIKTQLSQQHKLLAEEQDKSERLLLNVLPAHIARRLKDKQGLIADGHRDVTVMFADVANFTHLASQILPEQIVEILNTIFSGFDGLSGKHGLEKIKTVGDAYMVVGGLTREPQDYAYHIADMALEVREFVANCTELAQYNLAIHIGIASGPAVAGVVGVKRFVYDLWGDTVNVASRLTDAAPTGKILVDKATYDRLRQDYLFEPPINVNVQGKGDIAAYSLVRKG